ncbi:MAG: DUF4038 domain-containing protein [Hyphomicrobiaceae bacterium]
MSTRRRFPITIAQDKRYLIDAEGRPFLLHGDTAWSLIADLTREEVLHYLDDRQARGFNALLVNLIESTFARKAPANIYGDRPFLEPGDFGRPNEAYFAHAHWVLKKARDRGFLVLLAPAYLGYQGGSQGWYQMLLRNNHAKLRQYGRYVARRFNRLGNIVWVQGGDYNPPDRSRTRAVVAGIRDAAANTFHTVHNAPETAAAKYWPNEPWLHLNNIYTYGPTCQKALTEYARPGPMPFILIEGTYENEHRANEAWLRAQAYGALLCGAAGQFFGNNPIWHFNAEGLHEAPVDWRQALDARGTRSMSHLVKFFAGLPWWKLQPAATTRLVTVGLRRRTSRTAVAQTSDRRVVVLYMPKARTVTIDLARLAGPKVAARWFDPSNGTYMEAISASREAKGWLSLEPRSVNAFGFRDWVLVLRSVK